MVVSTQPSEMVRCDVERLDDAERSVIRFKGDLRLPVAAQVWDRTRALTRDTLGRVDLDLREVRSADSSTVALLVEIHCRLEAEGREARIVADPGSAREILDLYEVRPHAVCLLPEPKPTGLLVQVGANSWSLIENIRDLLAVVGSWLISTLRAIRHPAHVRWRDIPRLLERTGADSLPIVAVINFLVGVIMAFQSAMQLRNYGADLFVADLVGISVVRELGPLMTAILVASRCGASFAAELGTMRVSEEIDALRTLGFDPVGFLVLPRILALVLVVPLLTIVADFVAVTGGLLISVLTVDVTIHAYIIETQSALSLSAIGSGLIKAAAFGLSIGVVACQRGLAAAGGAEGVGRATTSAVVTILFVLVALDAVFAVLFSILQI